MRVLINGLVGTDPTIKLFKAADASDVLVRLMNDDGTVIDVTAGTNTLEFYTTANRSIAAVKSQALTTVTATAGHTKFTPSIAGVNFGPGTYYAFAKRVDGTGNVSISKNYYKFVIG